MCYIGDSFPDVKAQDSHLPSFYTGVSYLPATKPTETRLLGIQKRAKRHNAR